MPETDINRLQARLNAHRELLIEVLSILMADKKAIGGGAQGGPGDDLVVYNHEEDPGVLPTEAYAEEAEYAEEIRAIFRAARARKDAEKQR